MEQATSEMTATTVPEALPPCPEGEDAIMTRFGFYKRRSEVCRVAVAYPRTWEESLTVGHTEFVIDHVLAPALSGAGRTRRRAMTA